MFIKILDFSIPVLQSALAALLIFYFQTRRYFYLNSLDKMYLLLKDFRKINDLIENINVNSETNLVTLEYPHVYISSENANNLQNLIIQIKCLKIKGIEKNSLYKRILKLSDNIDLLAFIDVRIFELWKVNSLIANDFPSLQEIEDFQKELSETLENFEEEYITLAQLNNSSWKTLFYTTHIEK